MSRMGNGARISNDDPVECEVSKNAEGDVGLSPAKMEALMKGETAADIPPSESGYEKLQPSNPSSSDS